LEGTLRGSRATPHLQDTAEADLVDTPEADSEDTVAVAVAEVTAEVSPNGRERTRGAAHLRVSVHGISAPLVGLMLLA